MKEIYDWVPWFRELGERIAAGGEGSLVDKAKTLAWKPDGSESALLKYGDHNVDPLSFLYTLASQSKSRESRNRIYPSISNAFGMNGMPNLDLDDAFIFPTPPGINTLFHSRGSGDPELLWRLFRDALAGFKSVKPNDFETALKLRNIATTKLTQVLFLVNPYEFLPIDDHSKSLGFFESVPKHISLEQYDSWVRQIRDAFPGCQPYEANLFAYMTSSKMLSVHADRCFQVSTNAYDDKTDHWKEFESNNHVYTGGPGRNRKYPLAEAEPGNVILVRFGRQEGRGIGVVYRNDYGEEYNEADRLHVLWVNKTHAALPEKTPVMGFSLAGGTVDVFRKTNEYAPTFELLDRLNVKESLEADAVVADDAAVADAPFNQILYGPPGTGKTWRTRDLSLEIVGVAAGDEEVKRETFRRLRFDLKEGTGQIAMVTFHQNFAYEDFVEGIRPVLDEDGTLAYEMHAGIFKRLVQAAEKRRDKRFVLIIDEINRGNIAKIFGELITLIEGSRRVGQTDETHVTLPYSGDSFGIPDNLYVIGTMNTADRSIQLLDTALRRRFTFVEMMPDPEHEGICRDVDGIDCTKLLKAVNQRIAVLLDREHQIGHTYLLDVDTIDKLSETMRNRIFPLLQEYFFDDWTKIWAVLGRNAFIRTRKAENLTLDPESPDESKEIYERLPDSDPAWEEPEQYRRIYIGGATGETEVR